MAANPITFTEIAAYRDLTRADLSAWEVRLLKRIDLAVLAIPAPDRPATKTPEKQAPPSLGAFLSARARKDG